MDEHSFVEFLKVKPVIDLPESQSYPLVVKIWNPNKLNIHSKMDENKLSLRSDLLCVSVYAQYTYKEECDDDTMDEVKQVMKWIGGGHITLTGNENGESRLVDIVFYNKQGKHDIGQVKLKMTVSLHPSLRTNYIGRIRKLAQKQADDFQTALSKIGTPSHSSLRKIRPNPFFAICTDELRLSAVSYLNWTPRSFRGTEWKYKEMEKRANTFTELYGVKSFDTLTWDQRSAILSEVIAYPSRVVGYVADTFQEKGKETTKTDILQSMMAVGLGDDCEGESHHIVSVEFPFVKSIDVEKIESEPLKNLVSHARNGKVEVVMVHGTSVDPVDQSKPDCHMWTQILHEKHLVEQPKLTHFKDYLPIICDGVMWNHCTDTTLKLKKDEAHIPISRYDYRAVDCYGYVVFMFSACAIYVVCNKSTGTYGVKMSKFMSGEDLLIRKVLDYKGTNEYKEVQEVANTQEPLNPVIVLNCDH